MPLLVLFLLATVVWVRVFDLSRAAPLELIFFDVGQGDSTFIEIGGLYQILIDGGPGRTILRKLSQELSLGDRDLDMVLISHDDKDHAEGARFAQDRYEVDHMVTSDRKEGLRGSKVLLGSAVLDILSPEEGFDESDDNLGSIVGRLSLDKVSILFTGDIDKGVEEELLARRDKMGSSILKVAHHGSKTSSSNLFLGAVSPLVSVIQSGENNTFGHPHPDVLDRIQKEGSEILRTDQMGDVRIISDGINLIYEF